MAINLISVNNIENIHIAKYIADTEAEKDSILDEDRVQGTEVLVIEGNKRYRLDCNLQWVEIVSQGGGSGGSGGPSVDVEPISITQNGRVVAPYGKAYSPVNVDVPNTYTAEDEGKVVSNGGLVSQTNLSVTQNNTYDTTTVDSITVDVPPVGTEAPKLDVNFIDYDGKILYSYSTEDFLDLEELPETLTYDNLISEGWNWTLEDAKEYVGKYGKLWIGQTYDTISGMTEIDIEIPEGRQEICLTLDITSDTIVYWGDGDSVRFLDYQEGKYSKNHNYLNPGFYTIRVASLTEEPLTIRGENFYSQLITKPNSSFVEENVVYLGFIKAIRATNIQLLEYCFSNCYNLKTVTISKETVLASDIYFCNCSGCYSLKSFTICNTCIPNFDNCFSLRNISLAKDSYIIEHGIFIGCVSLKEVTLPEYAGNICNSLFNECSTLEELYIPENSGNTIGSWAFQNCENLKKVTISSNITEIKTKAFYNCAGLKEIHFKGRIPPAIYASDVFYNLPADCIIYVPVDRSETYMYTTNYPNPSIYTYIEEA